MCLSSFPPPDLATQPYRYAHMCSWECQCHGQRDSDGSVACFDALPHGDLKQSVQRHAEYKARLDPRHAAAAMLSAPVTLHIAQSQAV